MTIFNIISVKLFTKVRGRAGTNATLFPERRQLPLTYICSQIIVAKKSVNIELKRKKTLWSGTDKDVINLFSSFMPVSIINFVHRLRWVKHSILSNARWLYIILYLSIAKHHAQKQNKLLCSTVLRHKKVKQTKVARKSNTGWNALHVETMFETRVILLKKARDCLSNHACISSLFYICISSLFLLFYMHALLV